MSARVLLLHGPEGADAATRLAAALADAGVEARALGSPPGAREALDACECVLLLYDRRGRDAAWLDQAAGVALARGILLFVIANAPRGFVEAIPRPRSQRAFRDLAEQVRAALPATPRAAVRSLAQSSEARWTRAIAAEAAAELAARGWTKVALAAARDEGARVFAQDAPGDAWWKRVEGRRVWLRPRVAPFNPVDLVHVRGRAAPRVHEWWILRDGRSDAWMRRVYRGDAEKITPRTKFFGRRERAAGPGPQLIDKRILTQRVDRTGAIAAELAAIEAWLSLERLPSVRQEHVGAPQVDVPLHAG